MLGYTLVILAVVIGIGALVYLFGGGGLNAKGKHGSAGQGKAGTLRQHPVDEEPQKPQPSKTRTETSNPHTR